jgi:hypothetical protein
MWSSASLRTVAFQGGLPSAPGMCSDSSNSTMLLLLRQIQ